MSKMKLVILGGALVLFAVVFFSGCASTSSVNKRFKELEARTDENSKNLDKLSRKTDAVDSKADEALQKSSEALTALKEGGMVGVGTEELTAQAEKKINFDVNSYTLGNIAQNVLDEIGKKMQEKKGLVLEIIGHTDSDGDETYNLLLGHNRAESAMRYLREKFNIPSYRMYILSYGETKLEKIEDSPKDKAENRRVILKLYGPQGSLD
jgi:outer membrane protein OmpA-like peptidoglycan-associated protein